MVEQSANDPKFVLATDSTGDNCEKKKIPYFFNPAVKFSKQLPLFS